MALHPVASQKGANLVDEHFEPVMEEDEMSLSDADVFSASEDEERMRVPRYYSVYFHFFYVFV